MIALWWFLGRVDDWVKYCRRKLRERRLRDQGVQVEPGELELGDDEPPPPPAAPEQERQRQPEQFFISAYGQKFHVDRQCRTIRDRNGIERKTPCSVCSGGTPG